MTRADGSQSRYPFGVVTDRGSVRDHNEDAYLVRPPVFAVADGMGGHAAGEVAARLAVDSVQQSNLDATTSEDAVRNALIEANRRVYETGHQAGSTRGMGTTFVVLVLGDGVAHLGSVGDSRIYRLRQGELVQLTRDHTLIFEMVERGLIDAANALRDDGRGELTRALGGGATVDADVSSVDIQPGDRFLLCSDGLWSMVRDDDIRAIVAAGHAPQPTADQLVDAANAAGGDDNITALVVDVEGRQPRASKGRSRLIPVFLLLIVLLVVAAGVWLFLGGSASIR